jgi:ATP adenylyltransferase/5',5'''-P-1,P-4-tetraphosphate phosphorylase II
VLWDDWIVVIPRRNGVWEGASANTGGMMGSVWVHDQAEVDKWLRLGCANVLRELGVPR